MNMAMIKCFKCKKDVSDLVSSTCRHCGYSIVQSKINWEKLEKAPPAPPITHFDFDIEADRDALYEIIAPAILDESQHYDVLVNVRRHFRKFHEIACYADDCLIKNIDEFVSFQIKVLEYSQKKRVAQAEFALKTYKKQMDNIETPGLGFGIITNDVASAAAYTVLSKHEVVKQYLKQSNAAANQLMSNLPYLPSDNTMIQSDIIKYKNHIDDSLLLAQKLVDSNNYLADHPEFYSDQARYDTGLTIDGYRVFDILKSISIPEKVLFASPKKVLGIPDVPKEIISKLVEEGFLHKIGNRYCTSTKYERETIRELYWSEHIEEKQKYERRISNIDSELKQLQDSLQPFNKAMQTITQELSNPLSEENQLSDLINQQDILKNELTKLGLFSGLKKKQIQHQIDDLETIIVGLIKEVAIQKKARQDKAEFDIADIKAKMQPLMDRISILESEKATFCAELSKDR